MQVLSPVYSKMVSLNTEKSTFAVTLAISGPFSTGNSIKLHTAAFTQFCHNANFQIVLILIEMTKFHLLNLNITLLIKPCDLFWDITCYIHTVICFTICSCLFKILEGNIIKHYAIFTYYDFLLSQKQGICVIWGGNYRKDTWIIERSVRNVLNCSVATIRLQLFCSFSLNLFIFLAFLFH